MTTSQPQPGYRTRLSVVFASAAPTAVILRRGPKSHWRLITWDLDSDTFTPGQWMKGVVRLSHLSPNGRKLIYAAAKYNRYSRATRPTSGASATSAYDPMLAEPRGKLRKGRKLPRYARKAIEERQLIGESWTAVSTPPYFTALALWPDNGWMRGGFFHRNRELYVGEIESRLQPMTIAPLPVGFKIRSYLSLKPEQFETLLPAMPPQPDAMAVEEMRHAILAAGAEWVDLVYARSDDELLLSWDGCLFRLRDWRNVPREAFVETAQRLADFRDMQFERIATPDSARHW